MGGREKEKERVEGDPFSCLLSAVLFEPAGKDTRVTYTIEFDSKIPFIGGIIAGALKSAIQKGMKKASRVA